MSYVPYPSMPPVLTAPRYASFLRRAFAQVVDILLLGVSGAVLVIVARIPSNSAAQYLTFTLLAIVYTIFLNANGATMGKRLLGIRLIDIAGNPPGLRRASVRYIIPFVVGVGSMGVVPGGLDLATSLFAEFILWILFTFLWFFDVLWVVWHPEKQALRDRMAGTYVVKV